MRYRECWSRGFLSVAHKPKIGRVTVGMPIKFSYNMERGKSIWIYLYKFKGIFVIINYAFKVTLIKLLL